MSVQTLIILAVFLVIKLLKNKNNFFKTLNKFLKFKLDFKQILIAIIIVVVVDVLLILIQYLVLNSKIMPATFSWGTPIQPIFEEIFCRGLITYFFFIILKIYNKKLEPKDISLKSKIVYLFINALWFMIMHLEEPFNYLRFIHGLIFCGLYLYYDYNLVPSITAHIFSNMLMIWWF